MISGADVGTHAPPNLNTEAGTEAYAFNVVAHAAVGCGSVVASGGKCGPSALAGGVTSAAGPVINGQGFVAGLVINTALGGGAAVLGGGKFENGAITAAFGYLFNAAAGRAVGQVLGAAAAVLLGGVEGGVMFVVHAAILRGEIGSMVEDSLFGTAASTARTAQDLLQTPGIKYYGPAPNGDLLYDHTGNDPAKLFGDLDGTQQLSVGDNQYKVLPTGGTASYNPTGVPTITIRTPDNPNTVIRFPNAS